MGLGQSLRLGAQSGAASGAFNSGANYTNDAAYGDNGYSINNLQSNWVIGEFAGRSFAGGIAGGISGGASAGFSYGVSYYSNTVNWKRFQENGENGGIMRGALQKGISRESTAGEIFSARNKGDIDRGNGFQNFIARFGIHAPGQQRFEGGTHTGSGVIRWILRRAPDYQTHSDIFDPASNFQSLLGHFFRETPYSMLASGGIDAYMFNIVLLNTQLNF